MPLMPANTNADPPPAQGNGALILVVEDNEKNARLTLAMLTGAGYRAEWAHDGNQGQQMTHELRPALVVTDLQMPGMDGVAMTRALKSDENTRQIPVLAISAHALHEHHQQALAAGCCGFVTKPFRYRTLLKEVADAIGHQSPAR